MTDPTPLSPAAQAVLDATSRKDWYRNDDIAAALRAAADQMQYKDRLGWTGYGYYTEFKDRLIAIADELEGAR